MLDQILNTLRSLHLQQTQDNAPRVAQWLRARPRRTLYVAGGVIVLLFLFVITIDRNTNTGRIAAAHAAQSPAPSSGAATTQPTTAPSTQPAAKPLELFDPSGEGADPSWGLPAKLTTDDVRSLVTELDRLQQELRRLSARQQAHYDDLEIFFAEDLKQALWRKLVEKNFRDMKIPELYNEVLADETGVFQSAARDASKMAFRQGYFFIENRITAAQVRLFGGKVLVGDTLLVKSVQTLLDSEHAKFDASEPKRKELHARLAKEIEPYENFRAEVMKTQNGLLRLPHSQGYQRLFGATQNQ